MERSTHAVATLQTEVNRLRHELQTLQVDQKSLDAEDTITVADYLLNRLAENGVTVRLDPLNKKPIPLYSHPRLAYVWRSRRLQSWLP